ncbi:hypothetical protein BH10PSE14_BH10PSE14_07660 [soil metagenome]
MADFLIGIVDSASQKTRQTTWITAPDLFNAKMRADDIAEAAPTWLGGDTITIRDTHTLLASRNVGDQW